MYKRLGLLTLLSAVFLLGAQTASATAYAGVTVRLETSEDTFFDQVVYISDEGCTVTDSEDEERVITGLQAICALEAAAQAGDFAYVVDYYIYCDCLFVSSIGDYTNAVDFSEYWGSYLNLESMAASLDNTTVADGDEVLLSFGAYNASPLRITLDKSHVVAGTSVEATVDYYFTDWETNESTYVPLSGVSVSVGDEVFTTDEAGHVEIVLNEEGEYLVQATAEGYTRSVQTFLTVYPAYDEILQTVSDTPRFERVADALTYLVEQELDGMIGTQSVTEWAVQGIVAALRTFDGGEEGASLLTTLTDAVLAYEPKASDDNATTEIARHILALEALDIDSRDANGINFIARLKKTMSDKQFGEAELCNDDIFAGLALVAADESFTSKALRRAMKAALNCQNEDGGFGFSLTSESDVDTTAAWLMLAGEFKGRAQKHHIELKDARVAAFDYLDAAQHPDGGWGYNASAASNSSSTAWVMLGYQSHDIGAKDVTKNQLNGFDFLASVQGKKGGVQYDTEKTYSIIELNTAYALMTWAQTPIGQ